LPLFPFVLLVVRKISRFFISLFCGMWHSTKPLEIKTPGLFLGGGCRLD
jgi:hypothetical protein